MSLADAIIKENLNQVIQIIHFGEDVNQIDEYGYTPLVEAAIVDNIEIVKVLLQAGADPNLPDTTGGTALHWAVENNNIPLSTLLLEYRADPNAYTFAGQPVLVMPLLRQQHDLKNLLLQAGADLSFGQDYINAKLLGHMFELVGTANIVAPNNQFVELDFEGFYLEVTLGLISDSLAQYNNHFAARHMRQFKDVAKMVANIIKNAAQLIKYQQYRININKYQNEVNELIKQEPLVLPVAYEGHAITFVKFGSILVKCDRREDSRLFDNVYFYQVNHSHLLTPEFIKHLIFEKQSSQYINEDMPRILDLQPITELKVAAQISGNCSWANVEACIPTLFFLLSSRNPDFQEKISHYKTLSLNFFKQWREWNKDRALNFCIQSFNHADSIRKVCKAEILAAILFQRLNEEEVMDKERVEIILKVLTNPQYEYILQNYVRSYCYEDMSIEGKNFMKLLKDYGYVPPK